MKDGAGGQTATDKAGLARFGISATGAGRKSKERVFEQSKGSPKGGKSENIKTGLSTNQAKCLECLSVFNDGQQGGCLVISSSARYWVVERGEARGYGGCLMGGEKGSVPGTTRQYRPPCELVSAV